MKRYEALAGESISETARNMVALAFETQETVTATFNDVELTANPTDSPGTVEQHFWAESNRRHDEYLKSPEHRERQRKAQERQAQADAALKDGLAVAPPAMTFRDEPAWTRFVETNSDPYGSAVIRFADRWARLMESRIAQGETVQACADETNRIADNEGITGFMYGRAVSALSQVWIHGEDLRRWHLKTQIQHEGEAANESGGVLNPALLTIGDATLPAQQETTGNDQPKGPGSEGHESPNKE